MLICKKSRDRDMLGEIVGSLGAVELLGQLSEECAELELAAEDLLDHEVEVGPEALALARLVQVKCASLTKAAQKTRRALAGTTPVRLDEALDHLAEEAADVALCLDAVVSAVPALRGEIRQAGIWKLRRWYERVVQGRCSDVR